MQKEEIQLNDWKRILLGEAPWQFLGEVLLRSLFIYFFMLIVIRLLGKRMSGQLTITEIAVMLLLGAVVSVPMQVPERGVLQGVLLLFLILLFQRGLTWFTYKNEKLERFVQGSGSMLIKDGTILIKNKESANISDEQLFAILREKQIFNLGMSRNELAAIATLAAAMGMPLQAPDRGLLPGIIIAILVVLIQRGVAALSAKKSSIERVTQGKISILIEDHHLTFKAMKHTRISRERVLAQLRS